MATLSTELRNKLERTCVAARNLAEKAARAALEAMAVQHHEAYGHMSKPQKELRNKLRAHARQLGDVQDSKGQLSNEHLAQECGYEQWHRMLFARFLAENNLLIEPEMGVAISLDECKELAKDAKTNLWALAGRYAQTMLPEVFRADDPVLQVPLAREDQLKLEELLDGLPADVFVASDSLGWCYQFWQTERKKEVNQAEVPIGADELPSVTQLFTEDYMVDFLLDNTLGAWWAGRLAAVNGDRFSVARCPTEGEARKRCALPGCPWKYLRFVKKKVGGVEVWTPAAGTFEGWPKTAKELKCLDPCMGSGHFVVAMFERLVAMRMVEERADDKAAVAAVISENLFGLEIDLRCTQIGAFNLALAAWRRVGYRALPMMHIACSGLAPHTKETEWIDLARGTQKEKLGMQRLYQLFQKAPILGSLINPRLLGGDLLQGEFHDLQPILEKALAGEDDYELHQIAVMAQGVAKAAEILADSFTLVATNVPYLARGGQDEELKDYCERAHPEAKADLATCFVERCLAFCPPGATTALVTPQNWLAQDKYADFRKETLEERFWHLAVQLGPGAFRGIGGEVVKPMLFVCGRDAVVRGHHFVAADVTSADGADEKADALLVAAFQLIDQHSQVRNPKCRVAFGAGACEKRLSDYAYYSNGVQTGDVPRFSLFAWELPAIADGWACKQTTVDATVNYGGMVQVLLWEDGDGILAAFVREKLESESTGAWLRGKDAWGRRGVLVSAMGSLQVSLYLGDLFDDNTVAIIPKKPSDLPAIWALCSDKSYHDEVRKIDKALKVRGPLVEVPFDIDYWREIAAEQFPRGLPRPFSSDPTQWLFNGHPKGADHALDVAVARLLGYRWPRQTGSSFADCPALGEDGLEKLADADGIVCVPSVRGEEPAADRLRKLLAAAYGRDWKASTELELIRGTGSDAGDLEEWLRNDFFEQHCALFRQRPFIWHIWDGRKRDGFHVLVNYHKLAAGAQGRKVLESLTHSYLGEWITRQKDGEKRGEAGAEERLAAALELKKRLEAIIEGEPPYDIFARWKTLAEQPVGWEPDLNDGVRMNVRPFMADDLPNGKTGAGILRCKPNIKWEKDKGKEPKRMKIEFPWFWSDGEFTGDRLNDVHPTNEQKRKARKEK